MFNLLNLKSEAFGLDISDLSLKFIKLKKRGAELVLASFGQEKIKPGIIKQGEIKNEKALAEIIKSALTKANGEKIRTKQVVASLPEEKSFLQVIQMPIMPMEDLKSAVIYESENYIPLPIEQVYFDSQVVEPIHNSLDHLDVLIAALPKKTVDPYISCLKKAGLKPLALEIESLAVSRALIKNEITARPVLLIDLGQTRTSFIIFSGYSVRFTSSIPVSGQHFTEIISKALKVKMARAEELKIKWGLEQKIKFRIKDGRTEKKIDRGEIFEALIPVLVDLIEQIKKYLVYYQTHVSHEHLPSNGQGGMEKILLCGGGANLKGLSELLALEIKLPVEIGNFWINIPSGLSKEVQQLPFEKSLSYTTALGLALRGIKHD